MFDLLNINIYVANFSKIYVQQIVHIQFYICQGNILCVELRKLESERKCFQKISLFKIFSFIRLILTEQSASPVNFCCNNNHYCNEGMRPFPLHLLNSLIKLLEGKICYWLSDAHHINIEINLYSILARSPLLQSRIHLIIILKIQLNGIYDIIVSFNEDIQRCIYI